MNDVDGDGKFDLVIGNQSGGVVLYTQNNNNSIAESQLENSTIKIYPNPVSDFLNIESIAGQQMDLYTLQGNLIQSFTIGSGLTKIDLSNLSSGVYYLKSTSNHVAKVVKL